MKMKLLATLAVLLTVTPLVAELPPDIRKLFPDETGVVLENKGEVTGTFREKGNLSYCPRLPIGTMIADKIREMAPTFGVEACLIHQRSGVRFDSPENLIKIYNTLLGISTLKGILYYSQSRQRMRVFFHDAFRIESPDKKVRLPDLSIDGTLPADKSIYAFQDDSSFGQNVFDVGYRFEKNYFLMRMQNVNLIWYGIIPIIDPGNLVYYIVIYPRGEYLLFYSVIVVKGANPFGLMESKAESFYNRIKALDAWFLEKSGLF